MSPAVSRRLFDLRDKPCAGLDVNLHVRGHDYPLRSTMAAIEAKLDPAVFVRIHRSYLVNDPKLDGPECLTPA